MSSNAPRRHRLDPTALLAGLAFVAVGVAFLAFDLDSLGDQARVLWPLLLLALGVALLLGGWQRARREVSEEGRTPR